MIEIGKKYIYNFTEETKPSNKDYIEYKEMIFVPERIEMPAHIGRFYKNNSDFEKKKPVRYGIIKNVGNLMPMLEYKLDKIVSE